MLPHHLENTQPLIVCHNIIQIHNNGLTIWGIFHIIMLVPHNIVMDLNNVMTEWAVHIWPQTLIHMRMLGYAMLVWHTHPSIYLHRMTWVDTVRPLPHNCLPFKKGRRIEGRGWQWVVTTHANINRMQQQLLKTSNFDMWKKNFKVTWRLLDIAKELHKEQKVLMFVESNPPWPQRNPINSIFGRATFPSQPRSRTSTWLQYHDILIFGCRLSRMGCLARPWKDWVATDSRIFIEGPRCCL